MRGAARTGSRVRHPVTANVTEPALDRAGAAVSVPGTRTSRATLHAMPPTAGPDDGSPLPADKHYDDASAFRPDALLRQARRQRGLADGAAPRVCVLDPDGDIVRHLRATGRA